MDVKNLTPNPNLPTSGGIKSLDSNTMPGSGQFNSIEKGGPSFKDTLEKLQQVHLQGDLKKSLEPVSNELKFSNHAVDRMRSRGVNFSKEQMEKLQSAVQKAASKGSKDSLVLMDNTAVIVSVKNNTVVTVVDKNSLKDNVFTNIDSTIVI